MQDVAFGAKDISMSDGTPLKIPRVLRKQLKSQIYREYVAENTDPETGTTLVGMVGYCHGIHLACQ